MTPQQIQLIRQLPEDKRDKVNESVFNDIYDQCIYEVVLELHREYKMERNPCQICGQNCRHFVKESGKDIFGQIVTSNNPLANSNSNGNNGTSEDIRNTFLTTCQKCGRSVNYQKFAPHLQTCMGLGRTARSSRSRLLKDAEQGTPSPYVESDSEEDLKKVKKRKVKRSSTIDSVSSIA